MDLDRKTCNACGQNRALIAFYKNRSTASGYEARCKPCYRKSVHQVAGQLIRTEKRCSKCREVKPVKDFYKSKLARDGFASYCKQCAKLSNQEYRDKNPVWKIRNRVAAKLSRQNEDPDRRRKRMREYYQANKAKIAKQRKEKRLREAMQKVPAST